MSIEQQREIDNLHKELYQQKQINRELRERHNADIQYQGKLHEEIVSLAKVSVMYLNTVAEALKGLHYEDFNFFYERAEEAQIIVKKYNGEGK